MTKRSVTGFRTENFKPFLDQRPLYKKADIDRIIGKAGGLPNGVSRAALTRQLNKAARAWTWHDACQKYPTWRQQAKAFARIEVTAKKLLDALHISEDGDTSEMPFAVYQAGLNLQAASESQADFLGESLLGVVRLHRWARAARERADALAQRGGQNPKPKDDALFFLFDEIGKIWRDTLGKRLAITSRGPTVRFFQACLKPLPTPPQSDEAVRDRVRELRSRGE